MSIEGKFGRNIVEEGFFQSSSGTGSSAGSGIALHSGVAATASVSGAIAETPEIDVDQTVDTGYYMIRVYGSKPAWSSLAGYPFGILIRKKLNPGEVITLSGYIVNGTKASASENILTNNTTRISVLYESRPQEFENFSNINQLTGADKNDITAFSSGQGIVPASDGTNVGVITPWEYSSGENKGNYAPALNEGGTDFETDASLWRINWPAAGSDFTRYFRISIANDSHTPAYIKLSSSTGVHDDEGRFSIYKGKYVIESATQPLENVYMTSHGSINLKNSPLALIDSSSTSLPNTIGTLEDFIKKSDNTRRYNWDIRSINCKISKIMSGGYSLMPISSIANYWHMPSSNTIGGGYWSFESDTVGQLPYGVSGWSSSHDVEGETPAVYVETNTAGDNKVLALKGTVKLHSDIEDPPGTTGSNSKYRWVQYPEAISETDVVVKFKPGTMNGLGDYGLENVSSAAQEYLWLQYKVGAGGSWVTAGNPIIPGQKGEMSGGGHWDLTHEVTRDIGDVGQTVANPLYLRWICMAQTSSNGNVNHDSWVIDDLRVDVNGLSTHRQINSGNLTTQETNCFIAPADGVIRSFNVRFTQKTNESAGRLYLRVFKKKSGTSPLETHIDLGSNNGGTANPSPDVVQLYGAFSNASVGNKGWSFTAPFEKGDILFFALKFPAGLPGYHTEGEDLDILGSVIFRYDHMTEGS